MTGNDSVFRWLHLSDLHFKDEGLNAHFDRSDLAAKINEVTRNISINCLIITGDVFHQGRLGKTSKNELTDFITGLPGADQRIVVCPGNHDLDRGARRRIVDDCPDYHYRTEAISKAYQSLPTDDQIAYRVPKDEIDLIYEHAFCDFFNYFHSFNSQSSRIVTPRKSCDAILDDYELSIDEINEPSFPLPIRFFSLNTALFAGRPIKGSDLRTVLQYQKDQIEKAEQQHDFRTAARNYSKYARYIDDALTFDYVVDDKDLYVLTKQAEDKLIQRMSTERSAIAIMIGHHGLDMISDASKGRLKQLIKRYVNSGIYLCGHAHIPAYKKHPLDNQMDIFEFTAGGAFFDESSYAKYSFDIGEIRITTSGLPEISVITYFRYFMPSKVPRWEKETEVIPVKPKMRDITIIPPDQDKIFREPSPFSTIDTSKLSDNKLVIDNILPNDKMSFKKELAVRDIKKQDPTQANATQSKHKQVLIGPHVERIDF